MTETLAEVEAHLKERLDPHTERLVDDFALALKKKLLRSQVKYSRYDGWRMDDWKEKCLSSLISHLRKGDPLDVAAYCAFMWHHGWSTSGARRIPADPTQEAERLMGKQGRGGAGDA